MKCPTCGSFPMYVLNQEIAVAQVLWCPKCGHARGVDGQDRVPGDAQEKYLPRKQQVEALVAGLKVIVEHAWGDWKDETLREAFRGQHPDHPIVRAEKIIAQAEGRAS